MASEESGEPPSLLLLLGPLWSKVIATVEISFVGQIDLFKNYSNSIEPRGKTNSPETTAQKYERKIKLLV